MAPIVAVQFKLNGGWRSALLYCGGLTALVLLLSSAAMGTADADERPHVQQFFLWMLGMLQAGSLLLMAPGAIRRAVQRDTQNGMLESHRLTPLSGTQLALGYVAGPTSITAMLVATAALLGCVFSAQLGQPSGASAIFMAAWVGAQASVAFFALMASTLMLLMSLAFSGKGFVISFVINGLVVGGVFAGWVLIEFVPGAGLLLGVYSGMSIFDFAGLRGVRTVDSAIVLWTILVQLLISLILFHASAVKVRRPAGPVFTLPLAYALFGALVLSMVIGWMQGHSFLWMRAEASFGVPQTLGSILALLAAAFIPISVAAQLRVASESRLTPSSRTTHGWSPYEFVPLSMALLLVALLPLISRYDFQDYLLKNPASAAAPIATALLLCCSQDYAWCLLAERRGWRISTVWIVSTIVFRVLPFIVEGAVVIGRAEFLGNFERNWEWASLSPFGIPIAVAFQKPAWAGLAVQSALTVLILIRARRAARPGAGRAGSAAAD